MRLGNCFNAPRAGQSLLRKETAATASINSMIRTLVLALGCLAFLDLTSPPGYAQSQLEMNEQAGKRLEKADAEMNKVYKQILKQHGNDQPFVAVLKEGQRAWLKFAELHLAMLFFVKEGEDPRVEYGSMYPMLFAEAKTELVTARTKQLRELLEE
jgi:uncharacterized protein YecT (DUF1311 family)